MNEQQIPTDREDPTDKQIDDNSQKLDSNLNPDEMRACQIMRELHEKYGTFIARKNEPNELAIRPHEDTYKIVESMGLVSFYIYSLTNNESSKMGVCLEYDDGKGTYTVEICCNGTFETGFHEIQAKVSDNGDRTDEVKEIFSDNNALEKALQIFEKALQISDSIKEEENAKKRRAEIEAAADMDQRRLKFVAAYERVLS